ncbi:MAG: hypothetical protein RIE31_09655 [Alphaproteobacteria bacterium]|uniref:hypothetical protein n=1 Tax=Marinobacter salarius TaxID=1420917 RepID=UPI0032EFEE3F
MLADPDIFPKVQPPGYEWLADEPAFDARAHLALEAPERVWTMEELGYTAEQAACYASPIAVTTPVRLLSPAGVKAMLGVAEQLKPFMRKNSNSRIPAVLRGTIFRSRFMRDFCNAPEVTDYFSDLFQVPLAPHTLPHQLGHMNFNPDDVTLPVDKWHHDITALDYVLMLHNPRAIQGGRFEYFFGTREEGKRLLEEKGELPADRIVSPDFKDAGYAVFMQGCAVFHHASRLEQPAFRASLVNSYVSRDVRYTDANRTFFVKTVPGGPFSDEQSLIEKRGRYTDWARHKAWTSRAKLGTLLEELPFTEDRQQIIQALKDAVADVHGAIAMLEAGDRTFEEMREIRDRDEANYYSNPVRLTDRRRQAAE